MTALLELRGVTRTYGSPPNVVVALAGIDLTVSVGEMVAVMGPSGSGKSTMLTIAGGLETPTTGAVEVGGRDLAGLDADALAVVRRREIGFVFQDLNLVSGLTAVENVAVPLELDGVGASSARAAAVERLEAVGMGARADAFPDDLSGGERQRVAIARAVIGDRHLVLADEPTGALDSATGAAIMDLLQAFAAARSAVVVVTHDEVVAARADRVVRLRDGVVVGAPSATGAPR